MRPDPHTVWSGDAPPLRRALTRAFTRCVADPHSVWVRDASGRGEAGGGGGRADPPPEQVAAVDERDRHARRPPARSRARAPGRTRTARSAAGRRSAPAPRPRRASTSGYRSSESANTLLTPSTSSSDEPYVSAASDIHGRRQIGTNASYQRGVSTDAMPRVPLVDAERRRHRRVDRVGQRAHRGADVVHRARRHRVHREPRVDRARSRPRCGSPRRSRRRGRARARRSRRRRRSSCRRPSGTPVELAEAGARDRRDAERDQRLGRRRNQRDDATRVALTCARAAAPSSSRTRRR